MASSITQDTKISIDTGDLGTKIDSLKGAITQAINGINTSVGNKQSNFENALTRAVEHSIQVSSTRLNQFFETSVNRASKEVIQYETIINGMLTRIEKSNIVKKSSNHAINFEQQRMDAHSSQSQLIADQKKAFTDFKDALKQVASRLLTVSMMYDKMDQMQDMHNLAQLTHTDVGNVAYFKAMGQLSSKVDPAYLEDLYTKMNGLYGQRNSKEFADNPLLKELSKLKGQEHLVENLKKETNPDRFATMLIQAMAQGNKENADVFAKAIKEQFGDDAAVFTFLTDLRIKLESIETVAKARKDPSNIDPNNISLQADNIAQGMSKNAQPVLKAGFKRSQEQLQKDKTDMASTAQSAPALNAWNNFFEHFMRAHPEISKTIESFGALGSAFDDIIKEIVPIAGGALALRGGITAISTSARVLAPALIAVAPEIALFIAALGAAAAAGYALAYAVDKTYDFFVETPEQKKKREEHEQQHAQDELKANAPYIPTVDQNMNGQRLVYDDSYKEYKYIDPKTGKEAFMGKKLPEVKHAHDELIANEDKVKDIEKQMGVKIVMMPRSRGLFSNSGTIDFVVLDQEGNQLANLGRKLNASEGQIAAQILSSRQYSNTLNNRKKGNLEPILETKNQRESPVFMKQSIKDQPFNSPLSMDISKIKEQVSTSMQLSRQLLNTPNTMQQRFNFYFTLPQTNSGKIEHSFDHNSVVSRKGGGPLSNVDKAFPNLGAKGIPI